MRWQDVVLMVVGLCFSLALVPLLKSEERPALGVSIITAFLIVINTITLLSLHLWMASVTSALNAGMWAAVAIQKVRHERKREVDLENV